MSDSDTVSRAEYDHLVAERDALRNERDRFLDSIAAPGRGTVLTDRMIELDRAERDARTDAQVKARQAETARLTAERERAAMAEARDRLADYEGQTHQRFINNGGTDAEFRAAWPKLKEQWLVAQSASDPHEQRVEAIYEKIKAAGVQRF